MATRIPRKKAEVVDIDNPKVVAADIPPAIGNNSAAEINIAIDATFGEIAKHTREAVSVVLSIIHHAETHGNLDPLSRAMNILGKDDVSARVRTLLARSFRMTMPDGSEKSQIAAKWIEAKDGKPAQWHCKWRKGASKVSSPMLVDALNDAYTNRQGIMSNGIREVLKDTKLAKVEKAFDHEAFINRLFKRDDLALADMVKLNVLLSAAIAEAKALEAAA